MPPYTIENTPTRRKLSQEVVPVICTRGGIAGSGFYHFLPAHNRPNGPVSFKRTRIIRDLHQGAYCICACLQYSTRLDWKVIEWENQYFKLNNALSTANFRFRYLRSQISRACHSQKKERSVKGNLRDSVGVRKESVSGWLILSVYIYASEFVWHPHWAPWKNIGFSRFRSRQCHVGSNREVKGCVPKKAPWALGTILDSKLLSFKWKEEVSDILSASTQADPSTTWE
ncbi:hypothetical protein O181_086637 [Austropuccinia psidii MF-1]|uniref:Uncharacterized protein n=1 Tax=Austropuccinia psidii MF-1 TaxID=1389203 RepID=A0A9Q3FY75_9BASI|nr:hypothetical protein [Austropuccinia psidii MF-1]